MPGPPGPKCQKSPKKVAPGLSARSAKKVPKKSRKSLSLAFFRDFFDFFGTFFALRVDRPGTTFLRLFRHVGPGDPGTPCNWSLQSQAVLSLCFYKGPSLPAPVSTPASTPIFAGTCASTPASTLLEIPFRGPAPGRQGLKSRVFLKRSFRNVLRSLPRYFYPKHRLRLLLACKVILIF